MRTFHNINLIRSIVDSPYTTIGQRNYTLLVNYCIPYEFYTKVEYDISIRKKLETVPSIEEFVAREFGEVHQRSVRFDYYLGWIAEDERERFQLCTERIFIYEATFPLLESEYRFELNLTKELDLKNDLKPIFLKPGMFGITGFSGVRAFLDGYFRFKNDYQLSFSGFEQKVYEMINNWKNRCDPQISFDTWDREFRKQEFGTTDFTNLMKWEIERFIQVLSEVTKIDLSSK